MTQLNIVFFGSSDFSLPSLEFCLEPPRQLVAVVTTPDQPKGRGLHLQPNPVKAYAERLGILTLAPSSLKDSELQKKIESLKPDFFIVASYGKMIPSTYLKIPKVAPWNVHPSLLPNWRGAAPIPWQILEGEREAGVTIALVTPELDAGDVVHQIKFPFQGGETTESLTKDLAQLSKKALEESFKQWREGKLQSLPQDHSESNYARKLTKEDAYLDLKESAEQLERKIRAFHPWPGAFLGYQDNLLRLVEAGLDTRSAPSLKSEPGVLLEINPQGHLVVQTGQGCLKILKVQLPGRRVVSGYEFANGRRL